MALKRSRQLKPLSSEHHQALLVAFQLKQGLAGHAESAGAPRELTGLVNLARRVEEGLLLGHGRAEEELLGCHLPGPDLKRLAFEHRELARLVEQARQGSPQDARQALSAFAELLERHVRWEERELFDAVERAMAEEELIVVGQELERRLVLQRADAKAAKRA